jgi:hypothetical protein
MTRVLFVGQQPETVDFSDPAIPPARQNCGPRAREAAGNYDL